MKRIVAFILLVSLLPFSIFYSSYTLSAANDDSDIILGFINDGIKDEIDTPSDNNNTNPSDSPAGDSEDDEMSAPTLPEKGDDLTPTLPEDGEEPTEPEIPTEPETPEEPTTPEEPENSEEDEPSEEEPQEPQTPPARYEILLGLHSGKFDRFESSSSAYLAGTTGNDTIDSAILLRNAEIEESSGVKATYKYYPSTSYKWGSMCNVIFGEVMTENANAPDVYVSSVAEISAAALRGCFKNLNSSTQIINAQYRIDSLTFDSGLCYAFSGDYFFDSDRAMFALVYNPELMAEIVSIIGDADKSGVCDIADFAAMTLEGWNYDTLAKILAATPEGVQGLLVSSDESSARAFLTSSEFDIFDSLYIDAPMSAREALFALNSFEKSTASFADIRAAFCSGKLLFGGVYTLAELEGGKYDEVVGVAPLPTYKSGAEYTTPLSRYASVAAINETSKNEHRIAAFVNAANAASSGVFDSYVQENFSKCEANVDVLSYMHSRLSIGNDLDGEDVMYVLFGDAAFYNSLITSSVSALAYNVESADTVLYLLRNKKAQYLRMIISEYENLK